MKNNALPPPCGWPQMLKLFFEASATLIRQTQASEFNEHSYEQLLSATQRVVDYGRQGLSALATQPEAQALPPEWTPEMSRAVQLYSELGAYAASNLSGAYGLFEEFWNVAHRAAVSSPAPAPLSETEKTRMWLRETDSAVVAIGDAFRLIEATERHHGIGLDGGM